MLKKIKIKVEICETNSHILLEKDYVMNINLCAHSNCKLV